MLYLPRDPTLNAVFYRTTQVYGAFTDLLVLRGRTDFLCFQPALWGESIHKDAKQTN